MLPTQWIRSFFLTAAVYLLIAEALPAVYFEEQAIKKKSDGLHQFMSAMRGAQRLRYGKRSLVDFEDNDRGIYPVRMMLSKRMNENLPELIDSLNGAERLRFGK